jgi:hypothetical protein
LGRIYDGPVPSPAEIVNTNGPVITVLFVVVTILFAALAYVRTAAFRRRSGRNPWGIHPNLWLVIGFFLGIIGACLAYLACLTTRTEPAFDSALPPANQHYAQGQGFWSATPPPASGPPAGWYPDPSGRHHYRFFTGHDWTDDVVDNGAHSSEPLPAPPTS